MIKGEMRSLILYVIFYSYSIASQNCFLERLIHPKTDLLQALEEFYLIADDLRRHLLVTEESSACTFTLWQPEKEDAESILHELCSGANGKVKPETQKSRRNLDVLNKIWDNTFKYVVGIPEDIESYIPERERGGMGS